MCTRETCGWYTSHYCEENTLRLCGDLFAPAEAAGVELYVVFISNRVHQVPVWCQRLAQSQDKAVLWDYHGEHSSYRSVFETASCFSPDRPSHFPPCFDGRACGPWATYAHLILKRKYWSLLTFRSTLVTAGICSDVSCVLPLYSSSSPFRSMNAQPLYFQHIRVAVAFVVDR